MGGVVDAIGDVFGGGGGGDVEVNIPGPTAEETELWAAMRESLDAQMAIAESQQQLSQALLPISLEQIGYAPIWERDINTNEIIGIGGIRELPQDPAQEQMESLRQEIELGFLERTQAALAGELPVNPALLSDLEQQEVDLREALRKQLGPEFETSTQGIEALAQFDQDRIELLESARRGDLTLSEQLGIARQQANDIQAQQDLANTLGFTAFSNPSISQFGAVGQTGVNLLNNAISSRQLAASGAGLQAQLDAQSAAGFGQLLGTIGTAQTAGGGSIFGDLFKLGMTASAASDRRLKRDIHKIGEYKGLNVYSYEYVWGERAVGVMADEVEAVMPEAVSEHRGYKMVNYSML